MWCVLGGPSVKRQTGHVQRAATKKEMIGEKEKRGGEGRRILASSAEMSAPLVRFGSVSRQETAAGSGGNAKHPGNRPRTAPAQDQPSTPREG